jgi:hypothetical protein
MRNVSHKFVEVIKTHFLCSITGFRKSCLLWDNAEKYCIARQVTDHNMVKAYRVRIAKAKITHSEYTILIAFPLPQWLQEGAWMLRYTFFACLVIQHVPQQSWEQFLHETTKVQNSELFHINTDVCPAVNHIELHCSYQYMPHVSVVLTILVHWITWF